MHKLIFHFGTILLGSVNLVLGQEFGSVKSSDGQIELSVYEASGNINYEIEYQPSNFHNLRKMEVLVPSQPQHLYRL